MSRRGAVLENYQAPRPLDLGGLDDYLKRVDNNISNMASMSASAAARGMENKSSKDKGGVDFITGIKPEHSGIVDIDKRMDDRLLEEQNKMYGMIKSGVPLDQVKMYWSNTAPKVTALNGLTKYYKDQIDKGAIDLEKTYGNGFDIGAYKNEAYKRLSEDLLVRDEKGNVIGDKDINTIPKNKNYIDDIENDQSSLGTIFKPSGGLSEHVKSLKTTTLSGGEKRRDRFGGEDNYTISGTGTMFSQPKKDENGNTIGDEIKYELIPTGKNEDGSIKYVKALPKESYDLFIGTPKAKKEWDIILNEHLIKDKDIDPKQLDPIARDVYSRVYARDYIDKTGIDGHGLFIKKEEKQPKSSTTINNRYGGSDVPTMDIVTPIRDYFKENESNQKDELKGVAQINLFNNEVTSPIITEVQKRYPTEDITADNIYYNKVGNDIWVMKANSVDGSGKPKVDRQKDTYVFKLDDFSNIIGNKSQGQKAKNKSLTEAQNAPKEQPKQENKKFNIIDPSTGKVLLSGVDQSAADKAKVKGYKIQ